MKKLLLGLMAGMTGLGALAEVSTPTFFSSDFVDQLFNKNYATPQGYTTYGVEGVIQSQWSNSFRDYNKNNSFVFLTWGGQTAAACTPCGFTSGGVAVQPDQWLITPEIEVDEDDAMFCYSVMQSGDGGVKKFSVYISEGGTNKEDFTKLNTASITGSANGIATVDRRQVISGYKGKKIRMAFVVDDESNRSGIMGFYDLTAAQYYSKVNNAEDLSYYILKKDFENSDFKVSYSISTPVEVTGYTAVLRLDNGFESTYNNTSKLNSRKTVTTNIVFPDKIDFKGATEVGYTITITPNLEGMKSTVISGKLATTDYEYESSALVEEITGSWCGWCPRGIAFMNYYQDKYNSLGKGKVIPLMIHDGDMMQADNNYLSPIMDRMGKFVSQVGYPMALVNRASAGDPSVVNIDGTMSSLSYGHLNILEAGPDADDNSKIRVRAGSKLTFSTSESPVRLAVVLTENGVHGNDAQWNQIDYFGEYGESAVSQAYGEELVPYFKLFLTRTTIDPNTRYPCVPFGEMKYNEVVRAISPSYSGQALTGGWTADQVRTDDLLVDVTSEVQDITNCAVVAMLIGPDGNIIGSDILEYADWAESLQGSGVVSAVSEALKLVAMPVADGLGVKLNERARVSVWSVDGTNLYTGEMQPGEHILSIAKGGTVIVKAEGAGKTAVAKVVM